MNLIHRFLKNGKIIIKKLKMTMISDTDCKFALLGI